LGVPPFDNAGHDLEWTQDRVTVCLDQLHDVLKLLLMVLEE
jgi:hypothetical protein